MEAFRIEMAGAPVAVRCRFHENQEFFHDYFTEKEPLFTIEPTEADLRQMQADFDRMDEMEGISKHRRTESFLENNAIHSLLAERLVEQNVLLMHGSALCMDGDAYIFTAKSGMGKSTHARLWREVFGDRVWMINDDKPMVKISESGVMVYGTPWDGKHHLSRNASAPLKAIVNLTRDESNHIAPMSRADAFPVLIKQCFGSRNPVAMARVVELEKRLLNAVDFYALGCNMEKDAAKVAWEGMRAGHP
ncbi:MAG: hypothetical protein IKI84_04255 [Clostridia bacterium]|nr:hypothetical protein [Clostridia bacterium]